MSAAQDRPTTRRPSKQYLDNFDRIFRRQENSPPPEDVLDGEEFYNLMQAYRHAGKFAVGDVVKAFEAVKAYIRGIV